MHPPPSVALRLAAAAGLLALAACRPYADFSLPSPGAAQPGSYSWSPQSDPLLAPPPGIVDRLNPSVVSWRGSLLLLDSLYDGHTWHTHQATSPDGLHWSESRRILSPEGWEGSYIAANGAAVVFRNEILYYYQAGAPPRLALSRSSDGQVWRKEPSPVVDFGPRGAWDERAVADPYVFENEGTIYLYYLGENRARRQSLGLAVSTDGLHFTKLRSSPVLEPGPPGSFDENGLGEPAVWRDHGSWWMLYTGRARNEIRRLALARSQDGVHWTRTGQVFEGKEPWNAKVLCDPTVLVERSRVRVWFGGGDVAHPAENVHGRIGYADLLWHSPN